MKNRVNSASARRMLLGAKSERSCLNKVKTNPGVNHEYSSEING